MAGHWSNADMCGILLQMYRIFAAGARRGAEKRGKVHCGSARRIA
jgi:hypothetical protein